MQKKWGKLLICLLAFVIAGTFYCLKLSNKQEPVWKMPENAVETVPQVLQQAEPVTTASIYVHICGAVAQPGVYEVPEGSRVFELLAMAGGATAEGMEDAMNLADVLEDGERIVIPTREEASLMMEGGDREEKLVNLNTANRQELMTLPGIGETKADDIIRYRETNGSFKQITDIMKISGIKEALFEKIKEKIKV